MPHFVGLDVSLDQTSVCVVDDAGTVVRELKVASEPEPLIAALTPFAATLERVGLEAGPLSTHLYSMLAEAGLPMICVEVRHMARVLRAQLQNKTDRNDARGLAQMMRVGLFKSVHIKTERSQRLNVLLRTRKVLQAKLLDVEADLRGVLKVFGLKLGKVTPKDSRAVYASWPVSTRSWRRSSSRCSPPGGRCASSSIACMECCWRSRRTIPWCAG